MRVVRKKAKSPSDCRMRRLRGSVQQPFEWHRQASAAACARKQTPELTLTTRGRVKSGTGRGRSRRFVRAAVSETSLHTGAGTEARGSVTGAFTGDALMMVR